ncbi:MULTISPECIES: YrzI family small protein [Bacillaceae]|nr:MULTISPECIES: YrzI family small protein [Bacillaceae]MCM3765370.1 YrzI family small protein [Neobacillus niacini]
MTLNIFFFTLTINKRKVDLNKESRNELAQKLYEQSKDRQIAMHRLM